MVPGWLPGNDPSSRGGAPGVDVSRSYWIYVSPGEGLPPGTAPGAKHSPGKVLGWQTATATRGGSVLSLHYRD